MSYYLFLIQPERPFRRMRSCYCFAPNIPRVSLLTQKKTQVLTVVDRSSHLTWFLKPLLAASPATLPQDHWSSATPGCFSVRSPPASGSWLLPSSLPGVFPLDIAWFISLLPSSSFLQVTWRNSSCSLYLNVSHSHLHFLVLCIQLPLFSFPQHCCC